MRLLLLLVCLLFAGTAAAQQEQSLAFERGGYWLNNPATGDFALRAKGFERARLSLYRLTDPELLAQVITARAARSLGEGELLRRVADKTRPYWQADFVLDPDSKAPVIPVPADIAAGPLPSGIYVLTATGNDLEGSTLRVAQWFIRSPLEIKADLFGRGADVKARLVLYDTVTRQPRPRTLVSWLDAQGKVLGQATSDDQGVVIATKPAEAIMALAGNGEEAATQNDVAFADLATMRAQPLDSGIIYPAQASYQPGAALPVTFVAPGMTGEAPVSARIGKADLALQAIGAGLWQAVARVPANETAETMAITLLQGERVLAETSLPRMMNNNQTLVWKQKPASAMAGQEPSYTFQLLGGGKPVQADKVELQLQAVSGTDAAATPLPGVAPLLVPASVSKDNYTARINTSGLPKAAPATYRVQAMVQGQAVGQPVLLETYPADSWLDITPNFTDNAVAEGGTADFTVGLRSSKGGNVTLPVSWQLSREAYRFEWYQADDGRWAYRTKSDLTRINDGRTVNGKISVPVGAGRYRLSVKDERGHEGSTVFTAGWWLAPVPPQVPEKIGLKAQLEAKDGQDQLAVFIDPTFDARVWLTVMDPQNDTAARTIVADVPEVGSFVYIPRGQLPKVQPLRLTAFAVPAKPASGMVLAQGQLTITTGMPAKLDLPEISGKDATIFTLPSPAEVALLQIVQPKSGEIIAEVRVQDGKFELPPLAIDGDIAARLIAVQGGLVNIVEQPLQVKSDYLLNAKPLAFHFGETAELPVQVTATAGTKDKLRLMLQPPADFALEENAVSLPLLATGKPQTANLTIREGRVSTNVTEGYATLRLESRSGEVLAARPLWIGIAPVK